MKCSCGEQLWVSAGATARQLCKGAHKIKAIEMRGMGWWLESLVCTAQSLCSRGRRLQKAWAWLPLEKQPLSIGAPGTSLLAMLLIGAHAEVVKYGPASVREGRALRGSTAEASAAELQVPRQSRVGLVT